MSPLAWVGIVFLAGVVLILLGGLAGAVAIALRRAAQDKGDDEPRVRRLK